MNVLNIMEAAARNKANYLKAKELFNQKKVDACLQYYAADHLIKSRRADLPL